MYPVPDVAVMVARIKQPAIIAATVAPLMHPMIIFSLFVY